MHSCSAHITHLLQKLINLDVVVLNTQYTNLVISFHKNWKFYDCCSIFFPCGIEYAIEYHHFSRQCITVGNSSWPIMTTLKATLCNSFTLK